MKYYIYTELSPLYGETRHIIAIGDGFTSTAIEDGDSDLAKQYLAWLAEGNTPEPWNLS